MVLALILATLDTLPAPEEPQGEPEVHTLLTPLALRHFPTPWAAAERAKLAPLAADDASPGPPPLVEVLLHALRVAAA